MRVPFNAPHFDSADLENIRTAISSLHTAGDGPFGRRAERLLSDLHGEAPVLVTTSCSHSLEMAARLLNLKPGDEVIVPSYAFVTAASAFATVGARPVFADVREDTLNIDPAHVESLISEKTRGICIVHYAGVGAEPVRFVEIAERNGLSLVEDNAHGLGGRYQGKTLGTFGDLSTLSFHETKNITCGEGGALVVNRDELLDRARILRDKGTNRRAFLDGQIDKYTWVDIGSSWVLSDLLAAVLVGQLERFDRVQSRRRKLWDTYLCELTPWAQEGGIRLQKVPDGVEHTAHIFYLQLHDFHERSRFISHLAHRGVNAVFHYQALHDSPIGRAFGRTADCPVATRASQTLVRLPLYSAMTEDEQNQVIEAVNSFQL